MRPRPGGSGTVYRPTGRDSQPTRWYWLRYRAPGEKGMRRELTDPRTDDEGEARRQLYARLGERPWVRLQREHMEDLRVEHLLALYVADCFDHHRSFQRERLAAWANALGDVRALDVHRDHLDTICRHWQREGVAFREGSLAWGDGQTLAWPARARDAKRVRPIDGPTCNRYVAVIRRAYSLGKEKRGLVTGLTFPRFEEATRGEYLTEDQCRAICANFQAREGASVKADVFRLAYLLGIRKGQLRSTCKRHVLIASDTWKLKWPETETKNRKAHEVVLVGEARTIVERAWANRRPDCDLLFHLNGRPLGPMVSELQRTCQVLGIPYGRGKGVVFHDTRHSAVTNLVGAGVPEVVAMTVTGHADRSVFQRYNIRRDDVQADALAQQESYLAGKRGSTVGPARLTTPGRGR